MEVSQRCRVGVAPAAAAKKGPSVHVGCAAHTTTGVESISATDAITARRARRTNAELRVSVVVSPVFDWSNAVKGLCKVKNPKTIWIDLTPPTHPPSIFFGGKPITYVDTTLKS